MTVAAVRFATIRSTLEGRGGPLNTADGGARLPEKRLGEHELAAIVRDAGDAVIGKTTDGLIMSWNEGATLLIEAAPDAMVVADEHGTIRLVNRQTETLFGYTRDELLGQPIEILLPDRSRDHHPNLRGEYFKKPTVRPMGAGPQLWAKRKDGAEFPVDISRSPLETDEGLLVSAAIRDISEQLRVQEALQRSKDEAERANAAKSDFLSRMSHELRTPLSAILGFADLMRLHEIPPERQKQFIERIHKAGMHLLELINDVLDISRVESGTLSVSIEPIAVEPLIADTIELVQPMAAAGGIRAFSAGESTEEVVMTDANRLKQVLLNLLSNGVKYGSGGGEVRLTRERTGDRLRISVTDTGPGISEEDQSRLFQPFERLGAARSGVEGTGIGLALSSRLVELMSGTIGVESAEGRGSTFWIELPLASGPAVPVVSEVESLMRPAPVGARPFTVLCVEDSLSNFMVIEGVVALRPEIRLLPAIQGRIGFDLARRHRPDLILLDLNLPDVPGDEVLRRLKADAETAPIPVVVVSADAMPARTRQLIGLGAHAYITKPIDIKAFLRVVDAFLEQHSG